MFLHFHILAMQLIIELVSATISLPLQAVFQAFLAVVLFNSSTSHNFKKPLCFMQACSGFGSHSSGEGWEEKAFTSAAAFSAIAGYSSNNSCFLFELFCAAMCLHRASIHCRFEEMLFQEALLEGSKKRFLKAPRSASWNVLHDFLKKPFLELAVELPARQFPSCELKFQAASSIFSLPE